MKIGRKKQAEIHTELRVVGGEDKNGAPLKDKPVPTVGSGIAVALTRAMDQPVGATIILTEYGDTIYTAVRHDGGAYIKEGALAA